jgi:2,3-bisphosphoglycerate-dependent phosphoglycerate mutase
VAEESYHQVQFRAPEGSTQVILVRHGASAPAVPGQLFPVLDGHGDPPLAPEGEAQAVAVAARLSREPVDRLFVTGLKRTVQTAAPLADKLGIEPVEIPELREIHLGEWEAGEFRIRMRRRDPVALRTIAEERWDVIPGAESMDSFAARVAHGFERIVEATGPDATAVAFVHGGVIGEVAHQVAQSRPFAFVHADNASITRVAVIPGGHRLLHRFNDATHLEEGGRGG